MDRKKEIAIVKQLGEEIGYGNLMDIASGLWAIEAGHPYDMHINYIDLKEKETE